ncbi:MAG TPA: histidine kinase [Porphyromonadaceae bacterium]|nr:histidine kinase [Porphyromonadaceae bacterium]HBK30793.1 histidine kinase [Porphyromonadaceae bacterium]HBL34754.1 histidine kinase [Porphyromonadaceae bacterium]HBX21396.1 histidine kinase [Porphyromonadaceae bacterium]HBX46656.1 histidine kinase [Porphyromonadaceae bacterium]
MVIRMKEKLSKIKLQKKKPFILNYDKKTAIRAAIIISFILALVMLSSSLYYSVSLNDKHAIRLKDLVSLQSFFTLLVNTLVIYILFRLQFTTITRFRKRPAVMWLILSSLFVLVILLSPVISKTQWWWFREEVSPTTYSTLHYVKDTVILIISFLFTALIYFINQNQKKVTENQDLIIENLRNRYNVLKNQTNPHFLFNSLNTLNGLIGYDDERAREYLEQLTVVFRFAMQNREVIKLSEELKFAGSYIYLMKIRYNNGLNVKIGIDEKYKEYYTLPSALQLLIENAVKHNVVSLRNPLDIVIESTPQDTIRVKNNLQKKMGEKDSNGLGLANLNERFRLMFGKEIVIRSDRSAFTVEVPLIKEADIYKNYLNMGK